MNAITETAGKVCLLFPEFNEGFIMRKVPLGLAYIASSLRQDGISVDAYNLCCDPLEPIDFRKYDFVGITLLTPFINEVRRMIDHIKSVNPNVRIVLGGTHATLATEHTFEALPKTDYVIVGEGERSLSRLVLEEENYESLPGVWWKTDTGEVIGNMRDVPDINNLPFPDNSIFDHGNLEKRNPLRAIMTSRGCPWKCANCQPNLDIVQPYRLRKVGDAIDEIDFRQKNWGQTYFGFVDSEFPIKKWWFEEFYSEIRDRGIKFQFHCNSRADLVDSDILRMYKDLNISRLALGVESGVQRVVNDVINKRLDLDVVKEVFAEAAGLGIRTHAHFMVGIPGETLDEMRETLEFARNLPAVSIEFNILTPWPGTSFYDLCIEKDYLRETDVAKFNEKQVPVIDTEDFTADQVGDFYAKLRGSLGNDGWNMSPDGTVFYHPDYEGEDLAPPPAARPGTRMPGPPPQIIESGFMGG